MKNTEPSAKNIIPVILGSDINAYGIAHSFYSAYGVTSVLLCRRLLVACRNTKFISRVILEPNLEDEQVFLGMLEKLKDEAPEDSRYMLISCTDAYSELIAKHRETIAFDYFFNSIDYEMHTTLDRKETFYELCDQYGIDRPQTWVVTKDTYKELPADLTFPLIIKPANSITYWAAKFRGKRKVFLANNDQEYEKIMRAIYGSTYDDALVLQDYIPGDRDAEFHLYSDRHGNVKFMQFDEMVLGSPTPDGIGSHDAEITGGSQPELVEKFRRFLDQIGYKGFGNIDLRFDPRDETWKALEINLRLGRCSYAMTAAGYNFAQMIVEDVMDNSELEFQIADNQILYTIIPDELLRRHADERWLSTINQLSNDNKVVRDYYFKEDRNLLRTIDYVRNQMGYYPKYRKYYGKSMAGDDI